MVDNRLFIGHYDRQFYSFSILDSKCIALHSLEESIFNSCASKPRPGIEESGIVDFFLCCIVRTRVELLNLFHEEKSLILVDLFP